MSTQSINGGSPSVPPVQEQNPQKKGSFLQSIGVGSCSAVTAAFFIQWMIYFKNVRQAQACETNQGKSISAKASSWRGIVGNLNPRVLYRGFGGFAASFAPIVALQTGANNFFAGFCNPFFASIAAGVVSAVVVCPSEGIMRQQQQTGSPFWKTAKTIYANYGVQGFFRGFVPTAIREGAFTAAYLGATPRLKDYMRSQGVNEWETQVAGGVISGTVAAVISHPFDTHKTRRQSDFSNNSSMARAIFKKSAWAGLSWRISMIATATTIMSFVQEKFSAKN